MYFKLIFYYLLNTFISSKTMQTIHSKQLKREALNLNREDSLYLINLVKSLINKNTNKINISTSLIFHNNNNSAFINIPVIQVVIIQNHTNSIQQTFTTNRIRIDQDKSEVFSYLSILACILVVFFYFLMIPLGDEGNDTC